MFLSNSLDSTQYSVNVKNHTISTWYQTCGGSALSPGNEQKLYFGPKGVTEPGTTQLYGRKGSSN